MEPEFKLRKEDWLLHELEEPGHVKREKSMLLQEISSRIVRKAAMIELR